MINPTDSCRVYFVIIDIKRDKVKIIIYKRLIWKQSISQKKLQKVIL